MKTKAISIQISEPCTQNWDLMEDRDQERFCEACQKCVIDFSNHSNAEIFKIITNSNDSICGRFTATQLNQLSYHLVAVPSHRNWLKYLGVLAIGASLLANEAKATGTKSPIEIVDGSKKILDEVKPSKLKKMYGYVIDANNKPVKGITIVITNTKFSAKTDANGRYEMQINENLKPQINLIKIASFDASVKINFKTERQANLTMVMQPMIMGKIALTPKG